MGSQKWFLKLDVGKNNRGACLEKRVKVLAAKLGLYGRDRGAQVTAEVPKDEVASSIL